MNLDDNIDIFPLKKPSAKQGRRAGKPVSPDNHEISLGSDLRDNFEPPARVRKTGRWAEEGNKSARKSTSNLIEQERFHDSIRKNDSDDDIPIIPDIDDVQEEVLLLHETVVKNSAVTINKSTYKELNSEIVNLQNKIANIGNINLAYLTTHLLAENDVKESDELWTMDDLFENLISCNK